MGSEGYSTLQVCVSVCLSVSLRLFSDYRLRAAYERYQQLQWYKGKKKECGDFTETTAFEIYGVKTSEKANMHNEH